MGSLQDSIGVVTPAGAALSTYTVTGKWNMADASGGAADSSGNSYNLTAGGTPVYAQTGVGSNGIALDTTDYLRSTESNLMPDGSDEFTANVWINFTSNTGAQAVIGWDDSTGATDDCLIYHNTNGTLNLQTDKTLRASTNNNAVYRDGVHMITFIRRTSGSLQWYELWVDSRVLFTEQDDAARDISSVANVTFGFGVGTTPNPSHGTYNRARLYVGAALSKNAVTQLYEEGLSGAAA